MALQFVLGNSGSGKSEYMYHQLVKEASKNIRKNYLIVVPEQFTMETQRKLVDLSENHAIMNIDVLSFPRMAYRIFDELGVENLEVLEETGKNLVLRKVAQEKQKELSVLKNNMHRMGYIEEMKSFISELMQYNISPMGLESIRKEHDFSAVLDAKLNDVQIMYQGFMNFLENHYITTEEILQVLADYAKDSMILKDSVIVFDEFTGFTPVQLILLRKLLPICQKIQVSLTIDEHENFYHSDGMQDLFDMPKKTIQVLTKLSREVGVEILDPIIITGGEQKRFLNAPSLFFMEQNLFRRSYQRKKGDISEIQIYSIKSPREELLWTAQTISRLVREQNLRYQDIAVVTGSVENYANYVDAIYKKYQIPYFLDMTREVIFHPFIEFVKAILEVIKYDFSCESIMRLLRTGYCGMSQQDVDLLENYLLATGIAGKKRWGKKWLYRPKNDKTCDLEKFETLRKEFMEAFLTVLEVFEHKEATVEEQITALYHYIAGLDIEKQLLQREEELLQENEQIKAKEYAQIYRIVMDVFDKCVSVLGEEVLGIQELEEILDSGFEAAKVATIPPGYDTVNIGDIERTRLGHVKVLIFIGVNEGVIPKTMNQGGIISQYERETLIQEADISLAPGAREQGFIQKFYLYLNMTKPSEQLYISFSRIDNEGKQVRPSYLIRTLVRMFPDMKINEIENVTSTLQPFTLESARDYFLLGDKTKEWYALAKVLLESDDEALRLQTATLMNAFYYEHHEDPISRVVAEALYGKNIEGSVTRFEKFIQCAYAHFLSYGLKLREREEAGFATVDMGNLYHRAIEIYSRKLEDSSFDWFTVSEDLRDDLAEQSMEEAVLEYPNLSIYATAENEYMVERMKHIFRQTIWALSLQVRKGKFVPSQFEIAFSKFDELDALSYELEHGNRIQLTGRIDRLDLCQEDQRVYVKVIDYKSGSTKFDLLSIYEGVQLQLVVYMNSAIEMEKKKHSNKEVLPGALFYYHIDDPVIEVEDHVSEQEIYEKILEELKPNGLVNREESIYRAMDENFESKSIVIPVELKKDGTPNARSTMAETEEFEVLMEYVRNKIVECGNEIYEGNVKISPLVRGKYSGCDHCAYHAICGFDMKTPGYQERHGKAMKKEEMIEKMKTENAKRRSKQ